MTDNKEEWTDEEKAAACETIGAVPTLAPFPYDNGVYVIASNGKYVLVALGTEQRNQPGFIPRLQMPGNGTMQPVGVLMTNEPLADWECTPKKYVEDNFVAKNLSVTSKNSPIVYTNDTIRDHYLGAIEDDYKAYAIPMIYGATAGKREVAGWLLTGTPVNDYHAANKKYVDDLVASSHMVNISDMSERYTPDTLPAGTSSDNGKRVLVQESDGLYYYSYDSSASTWNKGYKIKGSTLYLNLKDGCMYRYTNSTNTTPYPNFIQMTVSVETIKNLQAQINELKAQ